MLISFAARSIVSQQTQPIKQLCSVLGSVGIQSSSLNLQQCLMSFSDNSFSQCRMLSSLLDRSLNNSLDNTSSGFSTNFTRLMSTKQDFPNHKPKSEFENMMHIGDNKGIRYYLDKNSEDVYSWTEKTGLIKSDYKCEDLFNSNKSSSLFSNIYAKVASSGKYFGQLDQSVKNWANRVRCDSEWQHKHMGRICMASLVVTTPFVLGSCAPGMAMICGVMVPITYSVTWAMIIECLAAYGIVIASGLCWFFVLTAIMLYRVMF